MGEPGAVSERSVLALLAAIQFVNILDFMMVMPLGPDFALALGIPTSHLGIIAGSYTGAAAISGLVGMTFLDRFDRKRALVVALGGLVLGTLAGGFATGFHTLLAARVLAGLFGGPAASLSLAVIADVIAPERRGRAMGTVMGSFSIASVLGVPAGLELARLGTWRTPFFGVAALGLIVLIATLVLLPPLRSHLEAGPPSRAGGVLAMVRRPSAVFMMLAVTVTMISVFAIVPNLATYLQFNAGYPRAQLGLLYFVGGIVSFFVMRVAGRLSDRFGTTVVATVGTGVFILVQLVGFVPSEPLLPVLAIFVGFMLSGSIRMVPTSALSTRVPSPSERARYMSVQSAVQHIAAAAGAAISSLILTELPGGKLAGMANLAWFSISLAVVLPFLIWAVESRVRASERLKNQPQAPFA